ncbi:LOG family protein [Streptomyces cacaoi]|uniref:LOG family protein n=1 Tax=Streptomyces cacaoi TaxID=1898 RepID=UPI00374A4353
MSVPHSAGPPHDGRGDPGTERTARRTGARPGAVRTLCVFCGASTGVRPGPVRLASELGRACARQGIRIVYGAGGVGVMGALSDAALAEGGEVVGVIPQELMDREFGRKDLTELRIVESMHQRKALMHTLGDAFLALPGGYGTLEELFEAAAWAQLGMHAKPLVLLDDDGFFEPLARMLDHARDEGFVSPAERLLVRRTRTVEEALHAASGDPTAQGRTASTNPPSQAAPPTPSAPAGPSAAAGPSVLAPEQG